MPKNPPAKSSLIKAPQQPKANAKTPPAPPRNRSPHKRIEGNGPGGPKSGVHNNRSPAGNSF